MSSSKEPMPEVPYIGVRAPSDIAKRDRSRVVYGFPLTYEWIQHRYHHEVELEAPKEEGVEVESYGLYLTNIVWHLIGVCQIIHYAKCTTTMVETDGAYGGGRAMFLVVGYPGRKPPPETLRILIDKLEDYGIVETPGWYPKA